MNPGILLPIIFRIITLVVPVMGQIRDYILTNEGGWFIQDLAVSSLIGNVAMNLAIFFFVKKFLRTFDFGKSFLIGVLCVFFQPFIFFILPFSNQVSYPVMFCVMSLRYAVESLKHTILLTCLVGRVSRYLPEGADTLGIMTVYTIKNVFWELSSVIEGFLLHRLDVKAGYYQNLRPLLSFYCALSIGFIMVLPQFVTKRVKGLKAYKN